MNIHPLYERLIEDLIKASPRQDLPNAEIRRKALYAFLERDSNDGRDTLDIPNSQMGSADATFNSLSFDDEDLEDL